MSECIHKNNYGTQNSYSQPAALGEEENQRLAEGVIKLIKPLNAFITKRVAKNLPSETEGLKAVRGIKGVNTGIRFQRLAILQSFYQFITHLQLYPDLNSCFKTSLI